MSQLVWIALGGGIGAVLRYVSIEATRRWSAQLGWEGAFGTAIVNIVGCLAIGVLAGLAESRDLIGGEVRAFAIVGLLGGFTTFSTFGWETFAAMRGGAAVSALASIALQVIGGLLAVALGFWLAAR